MTTIAPKAAPMVSAALESFNIANGHFAKVTGFSGSDRQAAWGLGAADVGARMLEGAGDEFVHMSRSILEASTAARDAWAGYNELRGTSKHEARNRAWEVAIQTTDLVAGQSRSAAAVLTAMLKSEQPDPTR